MNKRMIALSILLLGALVFVSPAEAQRRGGFGSARGGRGFVHVRRAGGFFDDSAFDPYLYSDYQPEIIDAPRPQTVQISPPTSPAPVRNPPESLVLESQGDHWVRITNYGQSQSGSPSGQPEPRVASNLPSATTAATPRGAQAAEPSGELPSAVLVFRDGHKEEIGKYAIVGPTIYTSADYWTSGSWTRKFQIAELDVPATLKLNQERGARFSLPSGPNEVMIRP
jgi:hypothetical protein